MTSGGITKSFEVYRFASNYVRLINLFEIQDLIIVRDSWSKKKAECYSLIKE